MRKLVLPFFFFLLIFGLLVTTANAPEPNTTELTTVLTVTESTIQPTQEPTTLSTTVEPTTIPTTSELITMLTVTESTTIPTTTESMREITSTAESVPIVVKFKQSAGKSEVDKTIKECGGKSDRDHPQISSRVMRVPPGEVNSVLAKYNSRGAVDRVSPPVQSQAAEVPDDPDRDKDGTFTDIYNHIDAQDYDGYDGLIFNVKCH